MLNEISKNCRNFKPFHYKSLEDLTLTLRNLQISLPIEHNLKYLKQHLTLPNIKLPNRLAIQPMEGFDGNFDGSPSLLTLRRYGRYARGGVGLIWFEAASISEDLKSNPHQLVLTEENITKFQKFVSYIKKILNSTLRSLGFQHEGVLILQLNHSGRYCRKGKEKYPVRAFHHKDLDMSIGVDENMGEKISDRELNELEDIWVKKAELAYKAGFDGVDIKSCHGYLISELLGARIRENSEYGGESFKNRTKFLLNIIKKINQKITSSHFLITTRLGIYDGIPYPYGFGNAIKHEEDFPATIDLSEPIQLIQNLYTEGIHLINISVGNPHYKPWITRPYDSPVVGGTLPKEHPLCSVYRMITLTSTIKKQIPKDIILIGSGYSYLRQFSPYICSGLIKRGEVDLCGFGRMSFANPNFAKQIFEDNRIDKKKVCITCSKCSGLMKKGMSTGCVIRDDLYRKTD